MHELSIAQSLMTTIETWRKQNGKPRVLSARVEIGRLSGVDPELLRGTWEIACENACEGLRHCVLNVDLLPLTYHCRNCGKDFESENFTTACPGCGTPFPRRSGGHELNLKNIEVE